MKVAILAGGFGTRLSEESHLRPKPMVEIGGQPILWHIMKRYSKFGHNEFVILAGYKQQVIKEYFNNYFLHRADVTFDFTAENSLKVHSSSSEPWKVTIADTGLYTMTGGRLLRARNYIGEEPFMMTYGDAVADVDLDSLLAFHNAHGKIATLTSVAVAQKYGVMETEEDGRISSFREKSESDGTVINGGFFVFNKEVFDYLEDGSTVLERKPFETLAASGELFAYRHRGFWQCMDTKREKDLLDKMIEDGNTPWL